MAGLSFSQFLSFPRCYLTYSYCYSSFNVVQLTELKSRCNSGHVAFARKKASLGFGAKESNENEPVVQKKTIRSSKTKTVTARRKNKYTDETTDENNVLLVNIDAAVDEESSSVSSDDSEKKSPKSRRSGASSSADFQEEKEPKEEKKVKRGRKSKIDDQEEKKVRSRGRSKGEDVIIEDKGSDAKINTQEVKIVSSQRICTEENVVIKDKGCDGEIRDLDESSFVESLEEEGDGGLESIKDDGENVRSTNDRIPLVCCFGSAQNAFVPSARPANRLRGYEIHERTKGALRNPENFYSKAPGGSAGSVAVALASLGGKVAFMGKLGDDEYGQVMLYYMNMNKVQTRSVRIDNKRATAVSLMKVDKRGRLTMSCVNPSAEDCLTMSEINIDVLKEAKMFYFSTYSLLDPNMRSTTLQAIKIAKKFGGLVFYDVNLPVPLWHSCEETKTFIQQVWNEADIVEVTKQELEFLCGIVPSEDIDTKNTDNSELVHYKPEVVAPLWHENLKVLFVTNGTSKIHYYTKELDGVVSETDDDSPDPYTSDMSASGDDIVAALMRMLAVAPEMITNEWYLEQTIKYAIYCGVLDQKILAQKRGVPRMTMQRK